MMRFFVLISLSFLILIVGCDQVNFTAPTGSTLTLTLTPPAISANSTSRVTVVGIRPTGAPLPDGTAITFVATLGTVTPNPAETKDGVATATFRAGRQSGTGTVRASSGDTEPAELEIIIGEARAANLILTADPPTLPVGGGTTQLKARVTDVEGNGLPGIDVIDRGPESLCPLFLVQITMKFEINHFLSSISCAKGIAKRLSDCIHHQS